MKIKIVLLDETEYWRKDIVSAAKKIFGVYYFDPNSVTHCCELTPSYELHFLQSVPQLLPDTTDLKEELFDNIEEGDWNGRDAVSYFHCSNIDKLPELKRGTLQPGVYEKDIEVEEDEDFHDIVREAWNANPDF
jgi:hypothetical protein